MANFHLLAGNSMVALSERPVMLTYLIKRHVVLFYQKNHHFKFPEAIRRPSLGVPGSFWPY